MSERDPTDERFTANGRRDEGTDAGDDRRSGVTDAEDERFTADGRWDDGVDAGDDRRSGDAGDDGWAGGRVAERLPDVIPGWAGAIGLSLVAFGLAMGLLIGVIVVFYLVAILASAATPDPESTARSLGQLIGLVMLGGYLTWLPIVAVAVKLFDLPFLEERPDSTAIVHGVVSFVVLAGLAVATYFFLPHNAAVAGGQSVGDPGLLVVVTVFVAFVGGGVIEELLFRGTIQGLLRDEFSAPAAIVGANVLFVPLHLFNQFGQPPVTMVANLTVITMLGLTAGYLFERHRTVVVPAAVHGAYNAVVIGAGLFL